MTYVELDLPEVIQEKRHIVEVICARKGIPVRTNLHLIAGNALKLPDLISATNIFAGKPIVIINEGLLPYFDHSERTLFAKSIHTVLERFGGIWITPDIDIQLPKSSSGFLTKSILSRTEKIESLTGIDVLKNRFESEKDAQAFFEHLGFHVERHSFMEVADQLAMPPQGSLAQKAIERGVLFIMTASGQY